MKTKILFLTIMMLLLALCNSKIFSQSWDKSKPFTLYATNKNGNVSPIKVGVGTSSPLESFHLIGRSIFQGKISADSIHVSEGLKIGNSIVIGYGANQFYTDNTFPFDLFIQCNVAGATNNTILNAIDNTGRTLIGITAPTAANAKLEVNGNINMSNATNGYFINGNEVLKYHDFQGSGTASTSNIFVAVNNFS